MDRREGMACQGTLLAGIGVMLVVIGYRDWPAAPELLAFGVAFGLGGMGALGYAMLARNFYRLTQGVIVEVRYEPPRIRMVVLTGVGYLSPMVTTTSPQTTLVIKDQATGHQGKIDLVGDRRLEYRVDGYYSKHDAPSQPN